MKTSEYTFTYKHAHIMNTFTRLRLVLDQWEMERLQGFRRDPLRDKIREVGRGLSLADTQTGR